MANKSKKQDYNNEESKDIELETFPAGIGMRRLTKVLSFTTLGNGYIFDIMRKYELLSMKEENVIRKTPKIFYFLLTIWVLCEILILSVTNFLVQGMLFELIKNSSLYTTIFKSTFMSQLIMATVAIIAFNQVFGGLGVLLKLEIVSSIERLPVFVAKDEQLKLVYHEFIKTIFISIVQTLGFSTALYNMINTVDESSSSSSLLTFCQLVLFTIIFFLFNMSQLGGALAVCCLGSILGKHLENFASNYIDTMYDELADFGNIDREAGGRIEDEKLNVAADNLKILLFNMTEANLGSRHDKNTLNLREQMSQMKKSDAEDNKKKKEPKFWISISAKVLAKVGQFIVATFRRLSVCRYPKSADMTVTKQSTALADKMTDSMKTTNNALIRRRLAKLQVVMNGMRDTLHNANIIMSSLINSIGLSMVFVVLTTTMSIQAKQHSASLSTVTPPILFGLGLGMLVVNTCVVCDKLVSESQSMLNKLFDFIIINQKSSPSMSTSKALATPVVDDSNTTAAESVRLSRQGYLDEALSETWSQFQFVRKMANENYFMLIGILPMTKRVVFVLLAYVLSMTFLAIEMKFLVDT